MEPVAGVGDITCSLLLPVSVLLARKNILELSFIFLGFFSILRASFYGLGGI